MVTFLQFCIEEVGTTLYHNIIFAIIKWIDISDNGVGDRFKNTMQTSFIF